MRSVPMESEALLSTLIVAARWALSLALYGSIMLGLSYAARRKIFALVALPCVIVLSLGFTFGVSLALERWELIPPAQFTGKPLGGAGVILSQGNTSLVLLKGTQDARGPRVVAFADRPLLYQPDLVGPNNFMPTLPPLPLGSNAPWFLRSIAIDLRLNAERLQGRLNEGLDGWLAGGPAGRHMQFFIYAGALVFFLASLGFLFNLSAWPLANLFTGGLVFRLILSLETFFNSPEMQDTFEFFVGKWLPAPLVVPLIFCVFALLIYIYSMLVYLAKRRPREE